MGKKKERQNSPQDDETSDSYVSQCLHVRKGVNLNQIKKQLHQRCWNVCEDCKTEEKHDDHPAVWLCLKCGHQGCGRNSEEQHALKHHEKQHSEPHCVVLNLDCWTAWCYLCDDEIHYEVKDQLGQFVAYIQKKTADKCVKGAMMAQTNEKIKGKEDNTTETGKHEKEKSVAQINQQIPVKGLSNLGNTCFFNAVMQILSQTYVLHELIQQLKMNETTLTIVTPDSLNLGQLEIHLDQPGPLSSAMCQFLLEFQDTKKNVVTPKELFAQVCKKAVRFKGFQQQDSQELLRYLLDGMRTEEIKRIGAGILKALNYTSEMMENEESKKTMKAYEKEGSMLNFVDRVFGGTMTSTIMCEECKMVTLVEESFLDLSLPVLDEQIDKKKSLGKSGRNIIDGDQNDNRGDCDGNFISKNRDDVSAGTSKYQQKKAKKQAKKQAKNQRQQQKHQAKLLDLENSPEKCSLDDVPIGKIASSLENKTYLESSNIVETVSPEQSPLDSFSTGHHLETMQKEPVEGSIQELTQVNTDIDDEEGEIMPWKSPSDQSDNSKNFDSSDIFESNTMNENQFNALCSSEDEENIINNLNKLNLNECIVNHDEITLTLEEYKNSSETNDLLTSAKDKRVVWLDPEKAFCTLTDREHLTVEDCSVGACLRQFTQMEKLIGANKLLCEECTQRQYKGGSKTNANDEKKVYTNARKQMLISSPPPILTLHLKRFQQLGFNLRKINKHIHFPQVLDLAPFCALNCKNVAENCTDVLYSLYGVVEHSGTMRSGHYTAYVKVRTPSSCLTEYAMTRCTLSEFKGESPIGNWFHISDTRVQGVPETKVLSAQAYLLFYERIL
ncbi:ubiquitin carboxyl-terminal hydrolase 16 [Stegostoma tigrinum]|uniref:ubiquitin carboxyl-terminal hydrolase 16 n=1 Tax=Stegostoma tigrinum TaxID=3053191 RepID=UPI00202ADDAE|nr:ubiquitin carboxyl-terminal hydrolase 16 [Stegostoma tigrinum]XP_048397019.1 ubiquitin carboxyl-terminal hydrolase 16 [Stegostoma tigrinum]